MGKVKQKKFKRRGGDPHGLQDSQSSGQNETTVGDIEGSSQFDSPGLPSTLKGLLEKVQSDNLEERFIGCSTLATLVGQKGCVNHLMRVAAVRIIGPLLVDSAQSVRKAAIGVLRNISVEGGFNVCEEMVKQDIMTPVISLLQQYITWSQSNPNATSNDFKKTEQSEVLLEVLNLLWNLCENSEMAVKIFDQNSLYQVLLLCQKEEIFGFDITLTAAQCLQVVTEDNSSAAKILCEPNIYAGLHSIMSGSAETPKQLLLKTVVTCILLNMYNEVTSENSDLLSQIISVLSGILQQDGSALLRELVLTIEAEAETTEGTETSCTTCNDEMDGNTVSENDAAITHTKAKETEDKVLNIECIVQSHQIALEMLTNLCCTEDEEWEDIDDDTSNNNSEEEMEELNQQSSVDVPNLATPENVYPILISCNILAKVLSKAQIPEERVHNALVMQKMTFKLLKNMYQLQSCSLLCLSNLFTGLDCQALGGLPAMQEIWLSLFQLVTDKRVTENVNLLEAATCALRSVTEKLVSLDTKKFHQVTSNDLQFLFEMGGTCTHDQVRANAIRILSNIGVVLSKVNHPLLKDIGNFLFSIASNDKKLPVIAEALDSIFDVFGEDNMNVILEEIQLIAKLKMLVPQLKVKMKQQKKTLGEHAAIVNTARLNLVRFIQYKENYTK